MSNTVSLLASPFAALGRSLINFIDELGGLAVFTALTFRHMLTPPYQIGKILQQVYFIGAKSLFVIFLVGLFTGMVLGLQLYYVLVRFGSEGLLGAAVSLALIRELGPVLTAIMIVGRAGSSMAAEIGIMRISEQIDALDTMDVNPVRFIVSPKMVACILSFPLLTAFFDVIGIIGGFLTGVVMLGINEGIYFFRIEANVVMQDVAGGFYKSLCFGILVAAICCYQGYFTHTRAQGFGAKGVSYATTTAVVISCVAILISDYVLTSLLL